VVHGLRNGRGYSFTVHATNAIGSSPESGPSATATPRGAPGLPSDVTTTATASSVSVSFTAPDDGGSPITRYEVSTDNGATWSTLVVTASGPTLTGTVTGLTAGTGYAVRVRAVNELGTGANTDSLQVTTLPVPVGGLTAVAGTTSVTVSWLPSSSSTVTGYTVHADPGPATCSTTSIVDTSCVIGSTVGVSYTYTVVAHSPAGDSVASPESSPVTSAAPVVPPTVPLAAPTTLTTTDGVLSKVDTGQVITVVGTGFLPFSTATIIVYSDPIVLGTAVTDANGDFTKPVTVPSSLAVGAHNLVASGVDPDGQVRQIRMPVTVQVTAASTPAGTVAGSALPNTGAAVLQLAALAVALTAAGIGLVAYARRRRSAALGAGDPDTSGR
jgi:titin